MCTFVDVLRMRFPASGFLQIRGRPRHPYLWLTLPFAGCVEDFHRPVVRLTRIKLTQPKLLDCFIQQPDVILRNRLASSCRAYEAIEFGLLDALAESVNVGKAVEDT